MAILKSIGRAIDTVGKRLGNPLPEFGISERLQGKTYASPKPAPRPAVKNANTFQPVVPKGISPLYGGGGTSFGGGGGGRAVAPQGGGGGAPQSSQDTWSMMQDWGPEAPSIDFDALIRPALDALEGTIPTLQQGFSEYETGQGKAKETQLAQTRQNIGEQEQTLGRSKVQQQQLGESAIDQARRQFAEIQQGLQARYGGATGTGRFTGELAGRETLGNIANIRTQLAGAMQQIDDKLVQVKEIGRIAEQDIEQKTQERIRQARESLNNQIAGIRQQQGMLQAEKARMTAESIQMYQNNVNQFKMAQQNFLRDLFVRQTEAENQLKQAGQRARETASYTPKELIALANQVTPAGLGFSASGKLGPGGTFQNPSVSIASKKEDDEDLF